MTKRTKWILGSLLGVLLVGGIVMQLLTFNHPGYDNPPVVQEPNWDSPETRSLAERACFDCHSNETKWPWYSYVFPMSEIVRGDVEKGREVLNFSEWETDRVDEIATEQMVDTISKNQMPLSYYLILHPEAQLTDAEKGQLINGLIASTSEGEDHLEAEELNQDEEQ